jgi:hypothetical protein
VLITAEPPRALGSQSTARLEFGEGPKPEGSWAGKRLLSLDGQAAFELSLWCGTCPFLFQRLDGANDTVSVAELEEKLAEGMTAIEPEVVERFAQLLPPGSYIPMLVQIEPRLVWPRAAGDYFTEDQVETWGIDAFWGLPEYPRTPYYRTFETRVDDEAHMFEFVVPMVPPTWNDRARVARHAKRLGTSSRPTAVAVTTLDVCAPAVDDNAMDWFWHWGLTHFLLDGHHKLEASASAGVPLQLLSLLTVDASLATPDQVRRVPDVRARPATARRPAPG